MTPPLADAPPNVAAPGCPICGLHADPLAWQVDGIARFGSGWVLRHHPAPAPLLGWLLLDSGRHLGGPADFSEAEAATFGEALARSCALVRQLTGCERVYVIAFGEGAPHLHVHLIPRHGAEAASKAWRVADLYRAVEAAERAAADPAAVAALVAQARRQTVAW
jgi:diadenosine tetraphosphate (Ap4A) HIT family hydrolase